VRLQFNEPVEAEFDPIQVRDGRNHRVDLGGARTSARDSEVVVVDLKSLRGGSYAVQYRVTSLDGHVVEGEYGFTVSHGSSRDAAQAEGENRGVQPAAGTEADAPEDAAAPDPTSSPRGLGLGALGFIALTLLAAMRLRRHKPGGPR